MTPEMEKLYDKAIERGEGYGPIGLVKAQTIATRDHLFTVDACGGDAELICVLQKVMAKFCEPPFDLKSLEAGAQKPIWVCTINPAAVAEWFYAKYGPTR